MRAGWVSLCAVLISACLFARFCDAQGQPIRLQSSSTAPATQLKAVNRPGRFSLEVSVTGPEGAPVDGLTAADFHLEDNGQPSRIFSVTRGGAADPFQLVLIVDELNPESRHIREAAQEFLRRGGGPLAWPVRVYVLDSSGLFSVGEPSRDGNALADRIAHPRARAARGLVQERAWGRLATQDRVLDEGFQETLSRNALGAVVLKLRDQPGRKLVLWMGAGWTPVHLQMQTLLGQITEFSTRMREARMVLDWVNDEQPSWYRHFLLDEFTQPAISEAAAVPERLALPVLAVQSGGEIVAGEKVTEALPGLVRQGEESYTVTFDPAYTDTVDDSHAIALTVSRPGAVVRTRASYYDEPSYLDQPNRDAELVSVAKLDEFAGKTRKMSGADGRRQLARMKLTERLSTSHLEELLPLLKDAEERQQLTALADASALLRLPAAETPNDAIPSRDAQRAMIQSAYSYLQKTISKLPDFFAERETTYYEPHPIKNGHTWKTFAGDASLYPAAVSKATVLYRDGTEVVSDEVDKNRHGFSRQRALQTAGEFGVALKAILYGAVDGGTVGWDHWERGPNGPEAVYHMHVPATGSRFATTYCCMPQDHGKAVFHRVGAYDGEFAVDPKSGAILRMAVSADFDLEREPDLPLVRSSSVIEYGPVDIGGTTHICPLRSVWSTRGRTVVDIHEWGGDVFVYGPFEDDINDMTFSGYHRFGSQSRILTGVEETPPGQTGPPGAPPQ